MKFGWINLINAVIVAVILIPNVIWYCTKREMPKVSIDPVMRVLEQIGRYGCIAFMILPILVWKFGFPSFGDFLIYMIVNGTCLLSYLVLWLFYYRRTSYSLGLTLAILPTVIFMTTGMTLRHTLLMAASVAFGLGHIWITDITHRPLKKQK